MFFEDAVHAFLSEQEHKQNSPATMRRTLAASAATLLLTALVLVCAEATAGAPSPRS